MGHLDVGGFFEFPAACRIERGRDAVLIDNSEVRGRQTELRREIGQIARRVRVVVGVNDGNDATSARWILRYDVWIACSSLAAHKMVEAREGSRSFVCISRERRAHLRRCSLAVSLAKTRGEDEKVRMSLQARIRGQFFARLGNADTLVRANPVILGQSNVEDARNAEKQHDRCRAKPHGLPPQMSFPSNRHTTAPTHGGQFHGQYAAHGRSAGALTTKRFSPPPALAEHNLSRPSREKGKGSVTNRQYFYSSAWNRGLTTVQVAICTTAPRVGGHRQAGRRLHL